MNIQELIRLHQQAWIKADKWRAPDLQDALCFLTEEVGEAMDAFMRLPGQPFFRHHPGTTTDEDVATELFDVIYMACTALDVIGADLMEVAQRKLAYGDTKRNLAYDDELNIWYTIGVDMATGYDKSVLTVLNTEHEPITVSDMDEDGVYAMADSTLNVINTGPQDQAEIDASYERWVAEDEEIGRQLLSQDDNEGGRNDHTTM